MSEEQSLPCADKLRFATEREAKAAATVAEHQHGTALKVYICRHCDWWHLSSL